jgi:signal transduction histidine kinase
MIYAGVILAALWLLQIVFLDNYYQSMKQSRLIKAGELVAQKIGEEDFEDTVEALAFEHNMSIEIVDLHSRSYYSINTMGKGSIISSIFGYQTFTLPGLLSDSMSGVVQIRSVVQQYYQQLINGEITSFTHVFASPFKRPEQKENENQMLLWGSIVSTEQGERYVIFLNASLEPLRSTTDIMKSQLFYVTLLLIATAFAMSWLISRRLSKPITDITESAKKLATGDYTPNFQGGGFEEIDRLAETLNYAADGLSRVEGLRRELVANVSHDLRTPLTMIKAYAEMIRDLTGNNRARREEQLDVIISEADRLTALVRDLLDISRLEDGQQTLNVSEYDLVAQVREMIDRLGAVRGEYTFEINAPESVTVRADKDKIGQVIHNLVTNAVNYTGEDKKITVNIIPEQTEGRTRVEIIDTGEGIPPEEQERIWERYYRARFHKRFTTGTGLGLSIVKSVLILHGAPFGVKSSPGEGSNFWFEL